MINKLLATTAAAILALGATACDGDDDASPTPDPTTPPPTAAPTPSPLSTGIPSVDAAVAALRARDIDALVAQAQIESIACATDPGLGGPPLCADGEAQGTVVDVFTTAQCEGSYIREPQIEGAFANLIGDSLDIYGIYRTPAQYYPSGAYTIVLEVVDDEIPWTAREVILDDAGITAVNFNCAETAGVLVENRRLTDAIVSPG